MAEHQVMISAPDLEIGKADVTFKMRQDRKVIGTLKLSKGGVTWVPKDRTYGHELKWKEFAEIIENQFK